MKLSARRKLLVLSIVQLCIASGLALSSWVSMLLNGSETRFCSQYLRKLALAEEQTDTRVHGHTPLEFARVAHSGARQLATYTGLSACASGVVVLVAGFQLFLAWRLPRDINQDRI